MTRYSIEEFEPDPAVTEGIVLPETQELLLRAAALTVESRELGERRSAVVAERRALLDRATQHDRQAKRPLVSKAVGLAESVVNREIGKARKERAGRAVAPA